MEVKKNTAAIEQAGGKDLARGQCWENNSKVRVYWDLGDSWVYSKLDELFQARINKYILECVHRRKTISTDFHLQWILSGHCLKEKECGLVSWQSHQIGTNISNSIWLFNFFTHVKQLYLILALPRWDKLFLFSCFLLVYAVLTMALNCPTVSFKIKTPAWKPNRCKQSCSRNLWIFWCGKIAWMKNHHLDKTIF